MLQDGHVIASDALEADILRPGLDTDVLEAELELKGLVAVDRDGRVPLGALSLERCCLGLSLRERAHDLGRHSGWVPDLDHGIGQLHGALALLAEVIVGPDGALVADTTNGIGVAAITRVALMDRGRLLLDLPDEFSLQLLLHHLLDFTLAELLDLFVVDVGEVRAKDALVHLTSALALLAGEAFLVSSRAFALEARNLLGNCLHGLLNQGVLWLENLAAHLRLSGR